MTTSNTVANQALNLIGNNTAPVLGEWPNFSSGTGTAGTAGKALNLLYGPCVATVQQQFEWDASRKEVNLSPSGGVASLGFAYEYLYPANGIQVWQIRDRVALDPFDPIPYNFVEGNAVVGTAQVRVIWTDVASAAAIYNNNPIENNWSPGFREAVVRLLASELAVALAGRPDTAQGLLDSASGALAGAKGRAN